MAIPRSLCTSDFTFCEKTFHNSSKTSGAVSLILVLDLTRPQPGIIHILVVNDPPDCIAIGHLALHYPLIYIWFQ